MVYLKKLRGSYQSDKYKNVIIPMVIIRRFECALAELINDSDHLADNFKSYISQFSTNVKDIINKLEFNKQIEKMDKHNRLLSVVKAFRELDLNPKTIDNIKMGCIFEELIRKFSENVEAGDHYISELLSL